MVFSLVTELRGNQFSELNIQGRYVLSKHRIVYSSFDHYSSMMTFLQSWTTLALAE